MGILLASLKLFRYKFQNELLTIYEWIVVVRSVYYKNENKYNQIKAYKFVKISTINIIFGLHATFRCLHLLLTAS